MDIQNNEIGRHIRARRKALGWSQEELASQAGRSVFTLSQIERGVNLPNLATLVDLAKSLECSLDDLVRVSSHVGASAKSREHKDLEAEVFAEISSLNLKTLRAVRSAIRAIIEAQN